MSAILKKASSAECHLMQSTGSAKHFVKIDKQNYRIKGVMYEKTPIKQRLPVIGSTIQFETITPNEYVNDSITPYQKNKVFTVRGYSQGIDKPLANNNFMLTSYPTVSGTILTQSFRVLDITLGLLRVVKVKDEIIYENSCKQQSFG